jgi:hypothetical protein
MRILTKMILEPEAIDIKEFWVLQDFFNAIEAYLIAKMKEKGYKSMRRTIPLPGTLMFSKRLSANKEENL